MTANANHPAPRRGIPWRVAGWGTAMGLIALPLIAMQFTTEVAWTLSDFVFAIALIGSVGVAFELGVRRTTNRLWRAGFALALLTGFLLIWSNLAVGFIGDEDDPANLAFFGVLAIAISGAFVARLEARGMARAMFAAAFAQFVVSAIAVSLRMDIPVTIAVVFIGLWLVSGLLFRAAAREG